MAKPIQYCKKNKKNKVCGWVESIKKIKINKNTISDRAGIWTMNIIKNILLTKIKETHFIFKYDLCVYVCMFISHQFQA